MSQMNASCSQPHHRTSPPASQPTRQPARLTYALIASQLRSTPSRADTRGSHTGGARVLRMFGFGSTEQHRPSDECRAGNQARAHARSATAEGGSDASNAQERAPSSSDEQKRKKRRTQESQSCPMQACEPLRSASAASKHNSFLLGETAAADFPAGLWVTGSGKLVETPSKQACNAALEHINALNAESQANNTGCAGRPASFEPVDSIGVSYATAVSEVCVFFSPESSLSNPQFAALPADISMQQPQFANVDANGEE